MSHILFSGPNFYNARVWALLEHLDKEKAGRGRESGRCGERTACRARPGGEVGRRAEVGSAAAVLNAAGASCMDGHSIGLSVASERAEEIQARD